MTAAGNFIDDNTLLLSRDNSTLTQIFRKVDENTVEQRMENSDKDGKSEIVLDVKLRRK